MMRHAWGLVCGLLACGAMAEDASPFLSLKLNASEVGRPEVFGSVLEAFDRYPACFDAVRIEGALSADQLGELKKRGLAVVPPAGVDARAATGRTDFAPRGLIACALRNVAADEKPPVAVFSGLNGAFGKTARGLCVESMLDLAYGAGGLEFNLLAYNHEPVAWTASTYLSELTRWRPFLQEYARFNVGTHPGGFLPYIGNNGKPDSNAVLAVAEAFAPLGIPVCPGSPWPVGYVLNAAAVDGMTAVDIQRVLSGGAVLDGGAAARLQARGYGAAMGLTVAARASSNPAESFTDDELNVGRVGYVWHPEAAPDGVFAVAPSNESARVLGRYVGPDGVAADVASAMTETASGGHLAVFGNGAFSSEMSAARRRQILLAADWVALNRLPVLVETVAQAVVIPRVLQAGDLRSVAVLNPTIDVQPPLTLRLRGCPENLPSAEWVTPEGKPVTVAVRWEGKDALVILPALAPWQIGWLRLSDKR